MGYRLGATSLQWTVYRQEGKEWRPDGYFNRLEHALAYLIDRIQRESDYSKHRELMDTINALQASLGQATHDVMELAFQIQGEAATKKLAREAEHIKLKDRKSTRLNSSHSSVSRMPSSA